MRGGDIGEEREADANAARGNTGDVQEFVREVTMKNNAEIVQYAIEHDLLP